MESENGVGWIGPLKVISCREQVALELDQVSLSPVQADLECCQGWDVCHLPWQPVSMFHHTSLKINKFLISTLNLSSFSIKPLPLVLLQQALLK